MSSNNEDNAWWSDYQASTKLKRKWKEKDETDNLDDLLSDLESISNSTDLIDNHDLKTEIPNKEPSYCQSTTSEIISMLSILKNKNEFNSFFLM